MMKLRVERLSDGRQWLSDPAIDLEIEEIEHGLLIRQENESYRATGWRLTEQVRGIIDYAFQNGLTCLIRQNHPRPSNRNHGVKYLGFSRRSDERWVFVLDRYSTRKGQADIIQLTFEKRFRSAFKSLEGIRDENGGGRNIFVPLERFVDALAIAMQHL